MYGYRTGQTNPSRLRFTKPGKTKDQSLAIEQRGDATCQFWAPGIYACTDGQFRDAAGQLI